jgi:hypothetical protein
LTKDSANSTHPLRDLFNRMASFETEENISLFEDEYGNSWPLFKFSIYQSYTLRYLDKNSLYLRIKKFINKRSRSLKSTDQGREFIKSDKPSFFPNDIKEIWVSNYRNRKNISDHYNKFIDPYFNHFALSNAIIAEIENPSPYHFIQHPLLDNSVVFNMDLELNAIQAQLDLGSPQLSAVTHFYTTIRKFNLLKLKKTFPELNLFSAVYEYEVFKNHFSLYNALFYRFPKLERCYLTSYYFANQMGMIAAANKSGIDTIDIQHGVQGKGHYAYSGWANIPKKGYLLLPSIFAVYSEKEKALLDKEFKDSPIESIIFGNKSHQYWSENRKQDQNDLSSNRRYILYTLQNQLPDSEHFIWQAIPLLKEKNIEVLFRLHPAYPELKDELSKMMVAIGVDSFLIDQNEDVYDSLDSSFLHITQFSSSTLDALLLNVPSLLIDPRAKEYFNELLNEENKLYYTPNLNDFMGRIDHLTRE